MGKKLWALGLVAAAAYLFKTKKGGEIRKKISEKAGAIAADVKEKYEKAQAAKTTPIDG